VRGKDGGEPHSSALSLALPPRGWCRLGGESLSAEEMLEAACPQYPPGIAALSANQNYICSGMHIPSHTCARPASDPSPIVSTGKPFSRIDAGGVLSTVPACYSSILCIGINPHSGHSDDLRKCLHGEMLRRPLIGAQSQPHDRLASAVRNAVQCLMKSSTHLDSIRRLCHIHR